jgi:hypothetical protein
VRWLAVAILGVGACTFRSHATGADAPSGSEPPPVAIDGPNPVIDARPDAPPDACVDDDSDGECNAVDSWPCGPDPTPPATTVAMMGNNGATKMTFTQISANGSQLVAIGPGQAIALSFHYVITDTACQSACVDQIEIGYVPGGRVECGFDHPVSKQTGAIGDVTTTLDAPSQPGEYDIRTNIGQNTSCGTTSQWWSSQPSDTRTIVRVCVH